MRRRDDHHSEAGERQEFSSERLRAWRDVRGIAYAELAQASRTSVAYVRATENGTTEPTPEMVVAWSAVLGCRPDQLLSVTPDHPAEYWRAANQAMPRMSREDLAVVAYVFSRNASGKRTRAE